MVAQLVDKLLSVCCGDNELLKAKMPWKKGGDKDEEQDVADTKPANASRVHITHKKKGKFTDKEMKYELAKWKDLPLKTRRAVQDIGLDQEKWDTEADVAVYHKHWRDFDEKELVAMEILGWDEAAWEHKYEHTSWADLPEHVVKAATAAGFDQAKWDGDIWPENLNKSWADLTEEDKQAMSVLGWHEGKWN